MTDKEDKQYTVEDVDWIVTQIEQITEYYSVEQKTVFWEEMIRKLAKLFAIAMRSANEKRLKELGNEYKQYENSICHLSSGHAVPGGRA